MSVRLIKTDVVPLSAFLMLISVLFFRSMSALRSGGDRLFSGFVMFTSARSDLTLSRKLSRETDCWTGGSQSDLTWKGCGSL